MSSSRTSRRTRSSTSSSSSSRGERNRLRQVSAQGKHLRARKGHALRTSGGADERKANKEALPLARARVLALAHC